MFIVFPNLFLTYWQQIAHKKMLRKLVLILGIALTESIYQWTQPNPPYKKLTMNIFSNDFTLVSDFTSNQAILSGSNLGGEKGATDAVTNFLTSLNNLPSDIDTGKTKTTLLSIQGTNLAPTTSLSNTNIIQVDLFQKDVDGIPMFYPNPPHSTMSFYVGSGEFSPTVVQGDFLHYSISSPSAMYPIKTADEAFTDLKEQKAYIPSFPKNTTSIGIKNVTLGYYLGEEKQQFVQPIYIFDDGEDFAAYVPAIRNEWIEQ